MPRAVPSNSLSFIFDVTTLASQLTQQETTSLNLETGQLLEKRNCAETVKKKKKIEKAEQAEFCFFLLFVPVHCLLPLRDSLLSPSQCWLQLFCFLTGQASRQTVACIFL